MQAQKNMSSIFPSAEQLTTRLEGSHAKEFAALDSEMSKLFDQSYKADAAANSIASDFCQLLQKNGIETGRLSVFDTMA